MIPTSLILLLLKATLLLAGAWGVTRLLARASAGMRHLVWLVTVAGLLAVPALATWAPLRVAVLPAAEGPAARDAQVTPSVTTPEAPPVTTPADARDASLPSAPSPAPMTPATDGLGVPGGNVARLLFDGALPLALVVWIAVSLALLLSIAWSWLAVRRILRRAEPLDGREWRDLLYEVADRFGLDEPPALLCSHQVAMPFACGVVRPAIVLPGECEAWSVERRRAVLLHELAHVRRRDLVGHTLARVACALYWFHPMVWSAAKALRNESERACDDMALDCGAHAPDYAEHLLEIVTSVRADRTPAVAMAMARRSEFEGRMLAILDPDRPRARPGRRQVLATTLSLGMMAVLISAAAPAPRTAAVHGPTARVAPDGKRDTGVVAAGEDTRQARALERSMNKSYEQSLERSMEQPLERRMEMGASAQAPVGTIERTIADVVQGVVQSVAGTSARAAAGAAVGAAPRVDLLAGRGEGNDDERAALLAKVLRADTSAALRRVAAWGLAEYTRQPVAVDALANALRRDASASVREMSAWALGEGGDDSAPGEQALAAAVRGDADAKVRAQAAWALGSIGSHVSPATEDALAAALGDGTASVRTAAAWALGNVEPEHAPRALMALLGDPDKLVRRAATFALFSIEDPAAVPALQAAMRRDPDKDMQLLYIRALAAMGERSVPALKELIESPDPRARDAAIHALAGSNAGGVWVWPWPQPRPFP
ncbi:MAG TPA: M56 family metallopeptidase [Gemmatimonadaceae bacterium]